MDTPIFLQRSRRMSDYKNVKNCWKFITNWSIDNLVNSWQEMKHGFIFSTRKENKKSSLDRKKTWEDQLLPGELWRQKRCCTQFFSMQTELSLSILFHEDGASLQICIHPKFINIIKKTSKDWIQRYKTVAWQCSSAQSEVNSRLSSTSQSRGVAKSSLFTGSSTLWLFSVSQAKGSSFRPAISVQVSFGICCFSVSEGYTQNYV